MQGHEDQLIDRQQRATDAQRQALMAGAEHLSLIGYDAFLWDRADPFYRSMALPRKAAALNHDAIAEMASHFLAHGRQPRAEFFEETWPGLRQTLTSASWQIEMTAPAMWSQGRFSGQIGRDVQWIGVQTPKAVLADYLDCMARSFGLDETTTEAEIDGFAHAIAAKRTIAATLTREDRLVAGAVLTISGNVAELQGVWVARAFRRQGYATSVCQNLLRRFLVAEDRMVWLSASGMAGTSIYRRIGFKPMGRQINMCWHFRPALT